MTLNFGVVFGGTKYDRICTLHDAKVKTHGCCKLFERRP
jgi:hypothetical protein